MYINKRGSSYHFRQKVPKDLKSYFNKYEIHRSIKSGNRRSAITQTALLTTALNRLFYELRQKRNMGGSDEWLTNYARLQVIIGTKSA